MPGGGAVHLMGAAGGEMEVDIKPTRTPCWHRHQTDNIDKGLFQNLGYVTILAT